MSERSSATKLTDIKQTRKLMIEEKNLFSLMHTLSKDRTEYDGNHIVRSWRKDIAARYFLTNFCPENLHALNRQISLTFRLPPPSFAVESHSNSKPALANLKFDFLPHS